MCLQVRQPKTGKAGVAAPRQQRVVCLSRRCESEERDADDKEEAPTDDKEEAKEGKEEKAEKEGKEETGDDERSFPTATVWSRTASLRSRSRGGAPAAALRRGG